MTGRPLRDSTFRRLNQLHRLALRITGGRLGSRLGGMRVVELHTIGRTSALPRSTYLTAAVEQRGAVVLVASRGGTDRHPDWFLNLRATPDVELTVDGVRRPFTARVASAEEKAALWPRVVTAYHGYAGYQQRTARDIPLVICEPRVR